MSNFHVFWCEMMRIYKPHLYKHVSEYLKFAMDFEMSTKLGVKDGEYTCRIICVPKSPIYTWFFPSRPVFIRSSNFHVWWPEGNVVSPISGQYCWFKQIEEQFKLSLRREFKVPWIRSEMTNQRPQAKQIAMWHCHVGSHSCQRWFISRKIFVVDRSTVI